jgi:hypothetical protein
VTESRCLSQPRQSPEAFRHHAITHLARKSGLADAELRLITRHAKRETLATYQHVALDAALQKTYEEAMKGVGQHDNVAGLAVAATLHVTPIRNYVLETSCATNVPNATYEII